jgi:hypothetical protein
VAAVCLILLRVYENYGKFDTIDKMQFFKSSVLIPLVIAVVGLVLGVVGVSLTETLLAPTNLFYMLAAVGGFSIAAFIYWLVRRNIGGPAGGEEFEGEAPVTALEFTISRRPVVKVIVWGLGVLSMLGFALLVYILPACNNVTV